MKNKRKKSSATVNKPRRQHKQISIKAGLPPGSLVHIGQVYLEKARIDLVCFNTEEVIVKEQIKIEDLYNLDESRYNWIKVIGLHEVDLVGALGQEFNVSQLMTEDVLNTSHRPKMEEDKDNLFFTMRSFTRIESEISQEQITFILGRNVLISFQESDQPIFEPVVKRLTSGNGKIRQRGLDYLLYCLIDVVVDNYLTILENIGDQLDEFEDREFDQIDSYLMESLQLIRKNVITLRKSLIPTQESVNALIKLAPELIDSTDLPYFTDVADHINQCMDFIDLYRELSNEIKESYLSNLSFRMNQVIKLLTIISTIFIPMTFIAGVYGMNFRNMPELGWKYGYFIVLGTMFLVLGGMLIYFRKKKWI